MFAPRSTFRPVSIRKFTHPDPLKLMDFTELARLNHHLDQLVLDVFVPVEFIHRIDRVPALGSQFIPKTV